MVEGGTRLMEGEGFAGSLRAANKALDPIQNIRTASRKLALEEDIAIRKALAVAKGKRTATGELLDFYQNVHFCAPFSHTKHNLSWMIVHKLCLLQDVLY